MMRMRRRGFTFLEILVALAILSLVGTALSSFQPGRPQALSAEIFARKLRDEMRQARAAAILRGLDSVVLFHRETKTFTHLKARLTLPDGLDVEVTGADAERRDTGIIGIRFMPPGKSTGGSVRIIRAKDSRHVSTLSVNWLTGEVSIAVEGKT